MIDLIWCGRSSQEDAIVVAVAIQPKNHHKYNMPILAEVSGGLTCKWSGLVLFSFQENKKRQKMKRNKDKWKKWKIKHMNMSEENGMGPWCGCCQTLGQRCQDKNQFLQASDGFSLNCVIAVIKQNEVKSIEFYLYLFYCVHVLLFISLFLCVLFCISFIFICVLSLISFIALAWHSFR